MFLFLVKQNLLNYWNQNINFMPLAQVQHPQHFEITDDKNKYRQIAMQYYLHKVFIKRIYRKPLLLACI